MASRRPWLAASQRSITSVIGVGHVQGGAALGVLEEQLHAGFLAFVPRVLDELQVGAVHAQDPVVFFEVAAGEPARDVLGKVVSTGRRVVGRARIRALAHMVGLGSAGLRFDAGLQASFAQQVAEDHLGGGRAADVPCANEKDPNFLFHNVVRKG